MIQGLGKSWAGLLFVLGLGILGASCSTNQPASPASPSATATPTATFNPSTGVAWFEIDNGSANSFTARNGYSSVVFDNRAWVIGGNGPSGNLNDVWYTSNGSAWIQQLANSSSPTTAQFSQREGQASVVYNNLMWVFGGYGSSWLNDVWSSPDGATWTMAVTNNASGGTTQFSQRNYASALVFNNLMWLIAGTYNADAWYSSNGVSWTAATTSAGFGAREGQGGLVYNGLMWVIGGTTGSYQNDVWSSPDGANWTKVLAYSASGSVSQFSPRVYFASAVYDNLMWVAGGYSTGGYLDDVWYSSDGAHWTQATAHAVFPGRDNFSALAFNNELMILGGWDPTNFNDVWETP